MGHIFAPRQKGHQQDETVPVLNRCNTTLQPLFPEKWGPAVPIVLEAEWAAVLF
jgi:hypothetical protein